MQIRKATHHDINIIMSIFRHARQFMRDTGNYRQWIDGYPTQDLIQKEIEASHCYVVLNQYSNVIATFCLIEGPDPTYSIIEKGQWLYEGTYHVIHRLASDGSTRGIANYCINWCSHINPHLRVDTHADNKIMQHLLQTNGFTRCGIIYVSNGTPRIAYERNDGDVK